MTEKEAYGLLGLRPGASDDAVKKAFRRISQKVHPDKGGTAALFCQVREAYELLTGKNKGTSQGSSGSANAEYADGAEERRKREEEARRRKTEEQRRRSEEQRKRREEERRRAEEAKKKKDEEVKKKAAFENYYERRRKAFSTWEVFKWSLVWGHFDRVDQKFEAERRELARRFGEAPRGRADETESWQTRLKKKNALLTILSVLLMFLILSSNPSMPPRVAEEPGSLALDIEPSDARVILPDIEPRYRRGMALSAGEYRVIVRRPGYEEFVGSVRIESGERATRSIVLRRARGAGRAVGTVFRDTLKGGGEGPEMVVLPTGSFRMGDLSGDGGSVEGPLRMVTIGKRIAMGRYEVTFADYDRFVSATGRARPDDEGWGRGSRPAINVSQEDAKAYAAWLSAQTGKTYRLPSESEWEYAARAGTTTRYSWGNEIGVNRANCYGCGSPWDDTRPAPVGSFEPNGFGLYDMHGNVYEWVADCWHDNYEGAPTDGSAWTTGCEPDSAVVRGGSWYYNPRLMRAAIRYWYTPSNRYSILGFRLVQDLNS